MNYGAIRALVKKQPDCAFPSRSGTFHQFPRVDSSFFSIIVILFLKDQTPGFSERLQNLPYVALWGGAIGGGLNMTTFETSHSPSPHVCFDPFFTVFSAHEALEETSYHLSDCARTCAAEVPVNLHERRGRDQLRTSCTLAVPCVSGGFVRGNKNYVN